MEMNSIVSRKQESLQFASSIFIIVPYRVMPYALKKVGKGYVVETTAGPNKGHIHERHPIPKDRAMRQIKALGIHLGKEKDRPYR